MVSDTIFPPLLLPALLPRVTVKGKFVLFRFHDLSPASDSEHEYYYYLLPLIFYDSVLLLRHCTAVHLSLPMTKKYDGSNLLLMRRTLFFSLFPFFPKKLSISISMKPTIIPTTMIVTLHTCIRPIPFVLRSTLRLLSNRVFNIMLLILFRFYFLDLFLLY